MLGNVSPVSNMWCMGHLSGQVVKGQGQASGCCTNVVCLIYEAPFAWLLVNLTWGCP